MAVSHTPALASATDPQRESRSRQAPPLAAFILAAFFAVIVFLPPEGRVGIPLHDGLTLLLGRASFMVPLALVFLGTLLVVRALRPSTPLPGRRLTGTALLVLGILPSEYLLGGGESSGLIGRWLSTCLLDLVGVPTTLVLLAVVLGLGVLLAFDLRLLRAPAPAPAPAPDARIADAEG